eukprot:1961316-Rhodomonas_salina.1
MLPWRTSVGGFFVCSPWARLEAQVLMWLRLWRLRRSGSSAGILGCNISAGTHGVPGIGCVSLSPF